MRKLKFILAALIILVCVVQCRRSVENPNAADSADALNTAEGMVSLVIGIKHRFAVNSRFGNGAVFNGITTNGFITREVKITSGANPDFVQLSAGGCTIASSNNTITDLWANYLMILKNADDLLQNVHKVREQPLRECIQQYAYLYKAMAMGGLALYWKSVPEFIAANARFIAREEALAMAINWLETASALHPELPSNYAAAFGTEIDLQNTILALTARYHLILGNYDLAISFAGRVDLGSKSVFFYNAQNQNPLFITAFSNSNGYTPQKNFGLPDALAPDPADQRIPFYLHPTGTTAAGFGFGKKDNDLVPIYLPGEILLISAEAYARKGDYPMAKIYLDKLLTKTPDSDLFRVGAAVQPYSGALDEAAMLIEIYKQRCIELFMSGMKLEDSRRFGRPGPKDPAPERTLDFLPYPFQERTGNSNTPPDPGC